MARGRGVPFYRQALLAALAAAFAAVLPAVAPAAGPANDPETCREIWQQIGLPTRTDDDRTDTTPICHLGYIASHNNLSKTPDWVLARLTAESTSGAFGRPDADFKEETALPPGRRGAVNDDYAGSKMDRGHQAASADFSGDKTLMLDTFFYSNAVPQQGLGFNQHIWAELEGLVQDLTRQRGEIVVITGPINLDGQSVTIRADADACGREVRLALPSKAALCAATDTDPSASCTDGVVVPAALYKIIYDPQLQRVNAYVMPNIDHRPTRGRRSALDYIGEYRVGVRTVEELTGLHFFTGLDRRTQRILRETCPVTMLH